VLDIEIGGRGGRVDYSWAAFIGPGERHAFAPEAGGANRFMVVDFASADCVSAHSSAFLHRLVERRFLTLSPAAHHLVGYAEQHLTCDRERDSRWRSMWLELLLESLCEPCSRLRDRAATALFEAKGFIERSFDQPIAATDIARAGGVSPSRLYELFQKHLGITPRRYLAQTRLRHALELLANTQLSLAEIAARTGHADQSTLTRHMRSALGVTPAAHRRSLRAGTGAGGERAHVAGDIVKTR
jgi:AraC-like DNA-binding protein